MPKWYTKSARSTASANNRLDGGKRSLSWYLFHSKCKERPRHTALASAAYSGNTWDGSMVQSSRTFTRIISPAAPKSLAVYRPSSGTNICTYFSAGFTIQYSRTPARWQRLNLVKRSWRVVAGERISITRSGAPLHPISSSLKGRHTTEMSGSTPSVLTTPAPRRKTAPTVPMLSVTGRLLEYA